MDKQVDVAFLVNPTAGAGGRVGLKGTDGMFPEALRLGADLVAARRAREFWRSAKERNLEARVRVVTCPVPMGEAELAALDIEHDLVDMRPGSPTTPEDTKTAVSAVASNVDLVVFVGGDGTARDVLDAMPTEGAPPVIAVPAGVKMYSGVFSLTPALAAELLEHFLDNPEDLTEREVVDADEEAVREDELKVELYGYLAVPYVPSVLQGTKQLSPSTPDERELQREIGEGLVETLDPSTQLILGPGTTVRAVADALGVEKTLLGVDVYRGGEVLLDASEEDLLESLSRRRKTKIVLSPIGRQGVLLGRGNQPISPEVVKEVGLENIVVVATPPKIRSLEDECMRVDTGDRSLDRELRGYRKVVTGFREWRMVRVGPGS